MQLKDESGGRKRPDSYRRVSAFHAPKGGSADKETRGHILSRNTPFSSGKRKISAQFAKRTSGSQGYRGILWHKLTYRI